MKEQALFVEFIGSTTNNFVKLHFSKKCDEKHRCMERVKEALDEQMLEVINYPIKMTFYPVLGNNLTGRSKRTYDIVNYSSTIKMIEDSLVQIGIIENDDNRFVYSHKTEKPTVDRTKGKTGILVVITEVVDEDVNLDKILKKHRIDLSNK